MAHDRDQTRPRPRGRATGRIPALPKDGVQPTREALNVIKDIIERRVNTTGVSEPVVVVQGDDWSSSSCPASRMSTRSGGWSGRPASSTSCRSARRRRPTGRSSTEQYPPLFSGDQLESAAVGQDQTTGGLTVTFVLKNTDRSRAAAVRELHPRPRRRVLRHRAGRHGHLGAHDRRGHPNGQVQIRSGGLGGFPAKEANSLVTVLKFAPCCSQSRSCRASRSRPRSASSSSIRASSPASSGSRS